MFGNLISNRQLKSLINSQQIDISPFEESNLKSSHYTLTPGRIFKRDEDGDWVSMHEFTAKKEKFILEPNEYVVIELRQRIVIRTEGIVGRFISTSSHIENGTMVVAGQIDSKYGMNNECIRIGFKNLLNTKNEILKKSRIVHVEFFDLRGITIDKRELTQSEENLWKSRKRDPEGTGPDYPQEDDI